MKKTTLFALTLLTAGLFASQAQADAAVISDYPTAKAAVCQYQNNTANCGNFEIPACKASLPASVCWDEKKTAFVVSFSTTAGSSQFPHICDNKQLFVCRSLVGKTIEGLFFNSAITNYTTTENFGVVRQVIVQPLVVSQ